MKQQEKSMEKKEVIRNRIQKKSETSKCSLKLNVIKDLKRYWKPKRKHDRDKLKQKNKENN